MEAIESALRRRVIARLHEEAKAVGDGPTTELHRKNLAIGV